MYLDDAEHLHRQHDRQQRHAVPAGTASINNSTNITIQSGATMDVSGRANGLLTLGGQTLTGSGTVNGSLSNAVGSTVAPAGTNITGRHLDRHQQRLLMARR